MLDAALLSLAILGPSPVIVPPPQNSAPLGSLAYGLGSCSGADSVLFDNNGVIGCQKLSDVAPQGLMLRAQPAFAGGTQTASNVLLCGGQDETLCAIDGADPSVTCAGENDTITVTVYDSNGTATPTILTEDQTPEAATDWTATASVDDTCASLATAVNALAGVGATCTSPNVRITLDTNTCKVTLAESTAACTTVGVGTAGAVLARNGAVGTPAYSFQDSPTIGMYSSASGVLDFATNGTNRISIASAGTITTAPLVTFAGGARFNDAKTIDFGSGPDATFLYSAVQTPDSMMFAVSAESNAIIINEVGDAGFDFAHALAVTPTVFIHSNNQNTTQWISMTHNATDAVIGSGAGDLGVIDDGGKGVTTYIRTNTEVLTFAANPGDASKVTSALCPVGVPIMGITTRVRTTATNCTSVQIGDGTDADMFSSATSAITAGTTTGPANYTAYSRIGVGQAAFNVTVTANGGNCFTGVWAVTCHYIDPVAATAN